MEYTHQFYSSLFLLLKHYTYDLKTVDELCRPCYYKQTDANNMSMSKKDVDLLLLRCYI